MAMTPEQWSMFQELANLAKKEKASLKGQRDRAAALLVNNVTLLAQIRRAAAPSRADVNISIVTLKGEYGSENFTAKFSFSESETESETGSETGSETDGFED